MTRSRLGFLEQALSAGVALSCVALPGLALAQQPIATQLAPIVVEGSNGETATGPIKGYAAKKSSTGSKADTPINEIPQSVSVIGREEFTDRGVTNKVDETLRYTAGVTTQPFGTDGDTDWFFIRGFDATQTGVFLDGLNLWSYGFGGFQIDPYFLERVEVLKGPASVLYGGSSPGGLVNLVGKRPLDEKFVQTEIGINNYGNAFVNFDYNDVVPDQGFSYRLTGKISGGDREADYSDDFRGVIMPQLSWSPDEATKLNVYGYYSYLDKQDGSNGFYPCIGTVVDAPFGKIDPDANYGHPDSDFGLIRQTLIGYDVSHEFDGGWTVSQNARYAHADRRENQPFSFGYYDLATSTGFLNAPTSADAYLTMLGFDHHTEVDSFAIDNHLEGQFDTGGLAHTLTLGLDYKYYELNSVQSGPTNAPISVVNPVYTAQTATAPYLDQTLNQQQVGFYAQDQIRFGGGWLATFNGRYDVVRTELEDHIGTTDYTSDDSAASGRAGLAYEFGNGLTPYVSAATFFNPLVGTTTGEPLKPEEGHQFEAGVKYEPTSFGGVFTASVFQITKKNWTVSDPLTFISSQIGEVTSTGFELEGKVDLNDDWKATASFSYQDLEITEHADPSLIGNTPYLAPKVTATAWLDYTVPAGVIEGMSIGGGLRYQGESWADMANTAKVPDVLLADAAIRYEKDGWGASLNVNNLFDKEYVSGCQGTLTCGYGEGRTIMLKLSKTW